MASDPRRRFPAIPLLAGALLFSAPSGPAPAGAEKVLVNDRVFYRSGEQYYRPYLVAGETVYHAVPSPSAPAPAGEAPAGVHPLLEAMCRELGGLPGFSLSCLVTREETLYGGETVQLSDWRKVHVARPGQLRSEESGDQGRREFWFNGREFVWLDRDRNTQARLAVAGAIEDLLDTLARQYDIAVPLAELLYPDPLSRLRPFAGDPRDLGIEPVEKQICRHLGFTSSLLDWEVWIQAEGRPLPRKVLIRYKTYPGTPRFLATFTRWDLEPSFPAGFYDPAVPEDAVLAEMLPVRPGN